MEAEALYDFAATANDELSFSKNAMLKILNVEEDANWYMAELNGNIGLIPCNYIQMKPHKWYMRQCSRSLSEQILLERDEVTKEFVQPDGAFILRQSEADINVPKDPSVKFSQSVKGFSLSLKEHDNVIHFKIMTDAGKYFIWMLRFDSVNKLIEYHRKTRISRNSKLILTDLLPSKKFKREEPIPRMIAVCDYSSSNSQQLQFRRGDVIEVLRKVDSDWWYGRMANTNFRGLFPTSHMMLAYGDSKPHQLRKKTQPGTIQRRLNSVTSHYTELIH
ncbi:Growth factor receptor-bound protein 2, partial [Cichlidogyrus casuarinus]